MTSLAFEVGNILTFSPAEQFDLIFCRNTLIYFTDSQVDSIVRNFKGLLHPDGYLFLGHSESVNYKRNGFGFCGNSVFQNIQPKLAISPAPAISPPEEILHETKVQNSEVLIVDDSKTIRTIVSSLLEKDFSVTVAEDAFKASEKIEQKDFNVIVLDIKMPGQSGLEWLEKIRKKGIRTPVVLLTDSSLSDLGATLSAVENLASDFIEKKSLSKNLQKVLSRIKALCPGQKQEPQSGRKALVVDDDRDICIMIANSLEKNGYCVECTHDGSSAIKKCQNTEFSFVLTDYKMPGMDGLALARNISTIQPGLPVVIISGYADEIRSEAEKLYNVNVISKPFNPNDVEAALAKSSQYHYDANIKKVEFKGPVELILIGASTGGPQILSKVLRDLPKNLPPIVVIQHIPFKYQKSFGQRLEEISGLQLSLVSERTTLRPGCIYFPDKDDSHLSILEVSGRIFAKPDLSPPAHGHRPAVDPLFLSASRNLRTTKALAVLLTGMGVDGAEGLGCLLKNNHMTIAQNKETSIVFGMPKAAIDRQAAQYILNDQEIREAFLKLGKISVPAKFAS